MKTKNASDEYHKGKGIYLLQVICQIPLSGLFQSVTDPDQSKFLRL